MSNVYYTKIVEEDVSKSVQSVLFFFIMINLYNR